jgi:hypothetical protein
MSGIQIILAERNSVAIVHKATALARLLLAPGNGGRQRFVF